MITFSLVALLKSILEYCILCVIFVKNSAKNRYQGGYSNEYTEQDW
jgi:hypothetical protein